MKRSYCVTLSLILLAPALLAAAGCGASTPEEQETPAMDATRYRVSYQLSCLETIDYMRANQLFNYLLTYKTGDPVDPAMQQAAASAVPSDSLTFMVESGNLLKAAYVFEPRPLSKDEEDGLLQCEFDQAGLPEVLGIPYVTCKGELAVSSTSLTQGDGSTLDAAHRASCLEATPFWPADDPEVKARARQITAGADSEAEKVEALFGWVRNNIAYDGATGSRYGTMQVLSQGYGRCWDASDVFVTLGRASGLPTRQVSGWLAGPQGSGHIWSQVWLEDEGWVDVDTTAKSVGADERYLPFRCTEDGEMPVLYVSMPEIEQL